MSDFFKSEMVRGDLQEMMELQQQCFRYAMSFPVLDNDRRKEYLEILMSLLEKQEIMYARLSLSDDPEAIELLSTMKSSFYMMGFPADMSMKNFFNEAKKTIETLRVSIDK